MGFAYFWHLIFIQGQCSKPSFPMKFASFHSEFTQESCQEKCELPWDLHSFGIYSLFRASAPNHHPCWDLHGFHRTCIRESCQKSLIYNDICMLLASGSVLQGIIPHGFARFLVNLSRDHARTKLIYHGDRMLLALLFIQVSAPNAWFHSEFIQGPCKKNLIYHGILMLLASNLYSGSVLPTLIPHGICMDFTVNLSRDHEGKNLIYHGICIQLASNLYSGPVLPTIILRWVCMVFIEHVSENHARKA